MKIYQSHSFEKKVKKLNNDQKIIIDKEIRKISQDPSIGAEKKGDLKGVFVYKFKIKTEMYLISYRLTDDGLELVTIGPHENYYRDLKSYLKNR